MSERFYRAVRALGRGVFQIAGAPLVLHRERAAQPGAFVLAANHSSVFDSALLIAAAPRVIYWLSIVELFQNPLSRWFLSSMGASPLDRSRADSATMRQLLRHLRAGRVVGIFPEGQLQSGAGSVLEGGEMREGACKLAVLAGVPVVPAVVVGGEKFAHWKSWLPLAGTRYAVAFGNAIVLREGLARNEALNVMAGELAEALRSLRGEVAAAGFGPEPVT